MGQAGNVVISVHDIQGRMVLWDQFRVDAPGAYRRRWTGNTRLGVPVAAGVYWITLHTSKARDRTKVTVLR